MITTRAPDGANNHHHYPPQFETLIRNCLLSVIQTFNLLFNQPCLNLKLPSSLLRFSVPTRKHWMFPFCLKFHADSRMDLSLRSQNLSCVRLYTYIKEHHTETPWKPINFTVLMITILNQLQICEFHRKVCSAPFTSLQTCQIYPSQQRWLSNTKNLWVNFQIWMKRSNHCIPPSCPCVCLVTLQNVVIWQSATLCLSTDYICPQAQKFIISSASECFFWLTLDIIRLWSLILRWRLCHFWWI